jgi:hypothetical protein
MESELSDTILKWDYPRKQPGIYVKLLLAM